MLHLKKHQLMLASIIVLISSTFDYIMLDPQLELPFSLNCGAAQPAVYAHVHILADHVTWLARETR